MKNHLLALFVLLFAATRFNSSTLEKSNFTYHQTSPQSGVWFDSDFSNQDPTQGGALPNQQNGLFFNWNRYYCLTFPNAADSTNGVPSIRVQTNNIINVHPDTLTNGSYRSEFGTGSAQALGLLTRWAQVIVQSPYWQQDDPNPDLNFQMVAKSVLVSIVKAGNTYNLYNIYYPDTTGVAQAHLYRIGLDTPGKVNDFVVHYVPSLTSTGILEIWRNGTKVFLTNGRTLNNTPLPSTFTITGANANTLVDGSLDPAQVLKQGIYKATFPQSTFASRAYYIRKVKYGLASCTIADFIPVTPPPTPGSNYILSRKKPAQYIPNNN